MSKNTQRQHYLHQLSIRGPFKVSFKKKKTVNGKNR